MPTINEDYRVFQNLDDSWGFELWPGTEKQIMHSFCPDTGKKMIRNEAVLAAERLLTVKLPETKRELFNEMSDLDLGNYLDSVMAHNYNMTVLNPEGEVTAQQKALHLLFQKFSLKDDFTFTEEEKKLLQKHFDAYGIETVVYKEE